VTRRLPSPSELRAAWWTHRALRAARRGLAAGELRDLAIPRPGALPISAGRGVEAMLRRRRHTCLEGALVRQRWLATQGRLCDVVIGVTAPRAGFEAHAWLADPDQPTPPHAWQELTRVAP
jgi:transglutaminase superfamily protein